MQADSSVEHASPDAPGLWKCCDAVASGDVPYEDEKGVRHWVLPDGTQSTEHPRCWIELTAAKGERSDDTVHG